MVIITKQQRAAGTVASVNANVNKNAANRRFTFSGIIDPVDLANNALQIKLQLIGTFAGVERVISTLDWQGGLPVRGVIYPPVLQYITSNDLPDTARCEMTQNIAGNFGVDGVMD